MDITKHCNLSTITIFRKDPNSHKIGVSLKSRKQNFLKCAHAIHPWIENSIFGSRNTFYDPSCISNIASSKIFYPMVSDKCSFDKKGFCNLSYTPSVLLILGHYEKLRLWRYSAVWWYLPNFFYSTRILLTQASGFISTLLNVHGTSSQGLGNNG